MYDKDNPIQDIEFDFGAEAEEVVEEVVEEPTQAEESTEEPQVEDAEPAEPTETPDETTEPETIDWGDLEIKGVDGTKKVKDMTKDEVQSRLRKGGDYDRIRPGYELSKELKEIAGLYGMDPKAVLESLKEDHFKKKAEADETTVDFEKRNYELTKKEAEQAKESDSKAQNQENINRFVEKYPDLTPADLPDEVLQAARNGEDMVTAYTMYLNQQMANDMKQLKLQIENAQKAPGASTTGNGTDENQSRSAFEEGFMD